VASSLLLDIVAALFIVATVKAMLHLEAHPVAEARSAAPALEPMPSIRPV